MTVRQSLEARLPRAEAGEDDGARVQLPRSLKRERPCVRTALLQRLAASRLFARGDRAGVLRAAQRRSGRLFRLDTRQRVIVKALVSRHLGQGAARGAALARHTAYLARANAGDRGTPPLFFDRQTDGVDAASMSADWGGDRHHFRFIVSPEHGDRIADLRGYVRDVMARVSDDLGEPDLNWVAVCHFDTDQPHAHVLVRGRRADGRDLVIPRDYIGYGFRARAQEVAQERLGDLSRIEAERRVWRETTADRFTGLDRRLLAAADAQGMVPDGVGTGPWAALSRGRLRHLERLGLAAPVVSGYRLAQDAEPRLRRLQLEKDILRTLHQRRVLGRAEVRRLGLAGVRGRVAAVGAHDALGAAPFVIVRDADGVEHYAALALGERLPAVGQAISLAPGPRGARLSRSSNRGSEASL